MYPGNTVFNNEQRTKCNGDNTVNPTVPTDPTEIGWPTEVWEENTIGLSV